MKKKMKKMRIALATPCLALALAAPDAAAQTADADLTKGVAEVEEGDFEIGITTLNGVVKRIAGDKARSKDLARAYLYLAIAYLGLREEAAAKARAIDALTSDPQLTLSPRDFPPSIISLMDQVRSQIRTPPSPRPRAPAEARTAFFESVRRGDFPAVRESLAEHPSLVSEKEPQFGATALHWAALRGNEAIVGLLVAQGADTSATNNAGETPVDVAIRSRRPEIVALLRPTGPLQKLIDGARVGDLAKVQQALAQDASLVNQKDASFGATALHWAALRGHRQVAEYLLSQGADRNARNGRGETPLQVAIRAKRTELVSLLQAGAVSGPPPAGSQDLDLITAVKAGDLSRVREIVAASPDTLRRRDTQFGATPLHWAALRGYREIAAYLLDQGADPSATNNAGETPLQVAERAGKKDVVEALKRQRP